MTSHHKWQQCILDVSWRTNNQRLETVSITKSLQTTSILHSPHQFREGNGKKRREGARQAKKGKDKNERRCDARVQGREKREIKEGRKERKT